jgi:hypothetical protein
MFENAFTHLRIYSMRERNKRIQKNLVNSLEGTLKGTAFAGSLVWIL